MWKLMKDVTLTSSGKGNSIKNLKVGFRIRVTLGNVPLPPPQKSRNEKLELGQSDILAIYPSPSNNVFDA